jgi:ribosomal protein S18 acetylase RimI-like enzyme
MTLQITLIPLSTDHHSTLLQEVYANTPTYWAMYNMLTAPNGQAERDLVEAAEATGRTMMGIVKPIEAGNPEAGGEMIGMVDFRLHWPDEQIAYLGMVMVAETYQRQGVGTQAWHLLEPWLATAAGVSKVRIGVEQFNTGAMAFFHRLGFIMTGEANRIKVGDKMVRLLYMEREIGSG